MTVPTSTDVAPAEAVTGTAGRAEESRSGTDLSAPPAIHAEGIRKSFGSTLAVAGAAVTVADGEFVALLGPSGSGKTTLLRVIAGFETPDAGTVQIGGRLVAGDGVWEEPDHRRIGMVFQDGALFPHLTVNGNVGFGHPAAGRIAECLRLVGLDHRGKSYPHELSGGERQRVALARALATDPAVVLLDEPFASLDAELRISLREEVAAIMRDAGASALLVTHDQQEALSLADTVVIMRDGIMVQAGTPYEVYSRPVNRWVAEFLDAAEVIEGTASGGRAETALGTFEADVSLRGTVDVLISAASIRLMASSSNGMPAPSPDGTAIGQAPPNARPARVLGRSFYGHFQMVQLQLTDGSHIHSRCPAASIWQRGDEVVVWAAEPPRVVATEAGVETAVDGGAGIDAD